MRAEIPVYLAAVGPKNVALAAEIADGWLPIWLSPERLQEVFGESLAGAREGFDIAAFSVPAVVTDDVEAGRDAVRPVLALYVGGMGTYYNRLVGRYGYEAEAADDQGAVSRRQAAGRGRRGAGRARRRALPRRAARADRRPPRRVARVRGDDAARPDARA